MVMDWTAMGDPPPIGTSPMCMRRVFRLLPFMAGLLQTRRSSGRLRAMPLLQPFGKGLFMRKEVLFKKKHDLSSCGIRNGAKTNPCLLWSTDSFLLPSKKHRLAAHAADLGPAFHVVRFPLSTLLRPDMTVLGGCSYRFPGSKQPGCRIPGPLCSAPCSRGPWCRIGAGSVPAAGRDSDRAGLWALFARVSPDPGMPLIPVSRIPRVAF